MQRRLSGPAIVAAVSSRKGGPGKSTLLGALGILLALYGFKVLIAEVDDSPYLYRTLVRGGMGPGGRRGELLDDGLTTYRVFKDPGRAFLAAICEINLAEALSRVPIHSKSFMAEIISGYGWEHAGVLHLIPGTPRLRDVEAEYAIRSASDKSFEATFQVRAAFEPILYDYDFILFDTPPSLAMIQRNILATSNFAFIPLSAKSTTVDDYDTTMEVYETVANICERRGVSAPHMIGAVINMYQPRTPEGQATVQEAIYQMLTQPHPSPETGKTEPPLIDIPILATVRSDLGGYLDAAIAARFPVVMYAPKSQITKDLITFAQAFLAAVGVTSTAASPSAVAGGR